MYFKDSVLSVVHDMIFAVARAGYAASAAGQLGFDNTLLYQLGYIFSILTCTKFILGPRFYCLNMQGVRRPQLFTNANPAPSAQSGLKNTRLSPCHLLI